MATKIGLQLYTLREFCKTPDDIARSLERVKKIGYDAVQVSGIGEIPNADLAKLLKQNELIAAATHTSWERLQKEVQKVIDEHKEIGCTIVGIGGMPREYYSAEGFRTFAKLADAVGNELAEAGLRFSYHNHSGEFERFDGEIGMNILREHSDPKYVNAEIDTYWVQHAGGDPAYWIERFSGRVPTVHLKDMGVFEGKPAMAEVGEGLLNWERILKACQTAGVQWHLVEQDTCRRDPFESVAISLKNLKAMGLS